MKYRFLVIAIIILVSCNDITNKMIVDEKTGKPMLIGKTDLNAFELPEFSEWYNTEYGAYEPDEFVLDQIKLHIDSVRIEVFMGTWCSDTRREFPRLIKILEQLDYDKSNLLIINLDRNKQSLNKEEKGKDIEFVPTIIIYKNVTELGRIIEFPIVTLESDLLNILLGIKE